MRCSDSWRQNRQSADQRASRRKLIVSIIASVSANSAAEQALATSCELATRDLVPTPGSTLQAQLDCSMQGSRVHLPGSNSTLA
jgi:hypothetical protein